MKLTLTRRGALALGFVALTTRLFYAGAIDGIYMQNAAWLSTLVGGVLALPVAFAVSLLSDKDAARPSYERLETAAGIAGARIVCAALFLSALADAAAATRMLAGTAGFVAFRNVKAIYLMLAAVLACLPACLCGGDAVSGGARIWVALFILLYVIVLITQIPRLHVGWLVPLLGPGASVLGRGALGQAGILTSIVPLWLMFREQTGANPRGGQTYRPVSRFAPVWLLAVSALAAGALLALHAMLAPAMTSVPATRAFALGTLLVNGRYALSVQFPLVLIWYGNLVVMLAFFLLSGAFLLHAALPHLSEKWAAGVLCAATLALALADIPRAAWLLTWNAWRYFALLPLTAALFIAGFARERKGKKA